MYVFVCFVIPSYVTVNICPLCSSLPLMLMLIPLPAFLSPAGESINVNFSFSVNFTFSVNFSFSVNFELCFDSFK